MKTRSVKLAMSVAMAGLAIACSPGVADTTTTSAAPSTTDAPSTTAVPAGPGTSGVTGDVSLEFAPEVGAGTAFDVSWTGEALPADWVAIVEEGSGASSYLSYFNTSGGSPGELVAPVEPGPYLIRFVEDATGVVLVELPITVTPFPVTLEAPSQVEPGATFEVTWTGPDGPGDYVTVAPAGAPQGAYLNYEYTTAGSPITLTAPADAGDYEIRYVNDGAAHTFATIPIEVG